jgi:hypothetical protein
METKQAQLTLTERETLLLFLGTLLFLLFIINREEKEGKKAHCYMGYIYTTPLSIFERAFAPMCGFDN